LANYTDNVGRLLDLFFDFRITHKRERV
jgi:hypothetical protein